MKKFIIAFIIIFITLSISLQVMAGENLNFEATAYCYTGRRTCSGCYPFPGTVAADNSILPIGTIIHIEGYGYAVVLDSGSVIVGNRIDLYFNTEKEAIQWGRRKVKVKILRRNNNVRNFS